MDRPIIYIALLLICILSRLFTGINYIEDSPSLIVSVNLATPHILPNFINLTNPLFCVVIKSIAFITRNFSTSFSIAGGVSVFAIIFFSLKLIKVPLASLEGGLVTLVIFFNPLIWIASNRYTPDIEATAIVSASFYFLMSGNVTKYQSASGWLLAGLLGGFSIMYIPFIILPLIYNITTRKHFGLSAVALAAGISLWLLPALILDAPAAMQSLSSQIQLTAASNLSIGRFIGLFRDIWAGGLGGFWAHRSVFTLLISLVLLPCLFFGTIILLSFEYPLKKLVTLWSSAAVYLFWLFIMEQATNISVLVFMPFLSIIISYGIIYFLVNFNLLAVKIGVAVFMLMTVWSCIYMAMAHIKPNAAEQLRQHLLNNMKDPATIMASKSFYDYLSLQGIEARQFLYSETDKVVIASPALNARSIDIHQAPKQTFQFAHNPFISRQWHYLELKEY